MGRIEVRISSTMGGPWISEVNKEGGSHIRRDSQLRTTGKSLQKIASLKGPLLNFAGRKRTTKVVKKLGGRMDRGGKCATATEKKTPWEGREFRVLRTAQLRESSESD